MLSPLLHEIHRLRKFIRDAQAEIDRAPKVHKAHQAKVAAQEKALTDAKEDLKKRKAAILTGEAQIKSLNQALKKHEKQLEELSTPRDIEAKQHDITNTKELIAKQEDEILVGMTEVDERTAKLPEFEAAVTKAKADFATYEKESAERIAGLKSEAAAATKKLAEEEAKLPDKIRGQYDRIVKAHGADALAAVENQSCSQCRVGITAQMQMELQKGTECIYCRNCGRALYLAG
jgi:predicted  nucleic acid-binding Zn-ribbon protein